MGAKGFVIKPFRVKKLLRDVVECWTRDESNSHSQIGLETAGIREAEASSGVCTKGIPGRIGECGSNPAENRKPCPIGILKSNREKEEDLVATGILPVIVNRQAGSLSYHSALPSDPIRYGYKTFEN